jgi:hypothetical protein
MLSTIDFDRELLLQTAEIQDVRLDRHLSPESISFQLIVADMAPKLLLRVGHFAAQSASAFQGRRISAVLFSVSDCSRSDRHTPALDQE